MEYKEHQITLDKSKPYLDTKKIKTDKEPEIIRQDELRQATHQILESALRTPGFIDWLLELPATSDRTFADYLKLLGITSSELGMKILDVGSSKTQRFAREASLSGREVISLNPLLRESKWRKLVQTDASKPLQSVAAVVQHLPFKNNSFDTVVSVFAIPMYLEKRDYKESLQEIYRVLKPGGRAILFPVILPDDVKVCKSVLEESGISYASESVPTNIIDGSDILPLKEFNVENLTRLIIKK